MTKYNCDKCGKEFTQKSHYDSHKRRKNPCENNLEKIKELVDKVVEEKIKKLNNDAIVKKEVNTCDNVSTKYKYKVLSLFSGIGGMDMGFGDKVIVHKDSIIDKGFIEKQSNTKNFVELKNNNFEIVLQNDILEGAKEVSKLNNTVDSIMNSNYIIKSIFDLLKEKYKFPDTDVIVGGFPCMDFSHCGKRKGFKSEKSHNLTDDVSNDFENSRGTLYKCFVEVVKQVKPKIFVAENVYGLLTMKGVINQIVNEFEEIGYDVEYQLVDCTQFGIPQTRKRVIIMGISNNRTTTTIPKNWNIITKNQTQCNVGKYFEHLKEPSETADISQQLYSKAKKLDKGQGQKEINMNSFAPTIRAEHHGNIEFRRYKDSKINKNESDLDERRLTIREAGLTQTFPPEYIFTVRNSMKSYKYIGNAVPPLLGYLIANKVEELIRTYFD